MSRTPRRRLPETQTERLSDSPQLVKRYKRLNDLLLSYQRLNDLLLAFHVVVDRKFHQLAKREDQAGATRFVDEIEAGLRAIYRHPEFRVGKPEGWKPQATEEWKVKVSEIPDAIASTADTADSAEAGISPLSTGRAPDIDCSPLCVDNGVCVPCD